MKFKAVQQLEVDKIPDDDICLETHVSFLSAGNELSGGGNGDDGDFVVVASEKALGACDDVPHYDLIADWVDEVFIIGMEY
jgi:hypothetical protein